jgi:hypothetical protein
MSATRPGSVRCRAQTRSGAACKGTAIADGLCFAHQPQAREWHAKGGAATSNASRAAKLLPSRLRPVVSILEAALAQTFRGQMEPRVAVALASVAGAIVRCVTAGELDERVRLLEQQASDEGRFRDRYGNAKGAPLQWPSPGA